MMSWGLIPSWSKTQVSGRMINARVETLLDRPSFSGALITRRCLVPADGFYEWRSDKKSGPKVPVRFERHDKELFAFAGLWDVWRRPDGSELETYTIITTESDGIARTVHRRMPVILTPSAEDRWLDPVLRDGEALSGVLSCGSSVGLRHYRVSNMINSPQNDSPDCVAEVEDETRDLFT